MRKVDYVRLRDSYKRFVKTWICFANPWISTVSWITNPDFKRFVSYRESRIQSIFKRFVSRIHFADSFRDAFSKDSTNLTNPTNPHESLVLQTYESIRILYFRIRESSQFSKDSFRGFVSWIRFVTQFTNTRFVDSIRKTKNLKRFDSFHFRRIRIRIPHPQDYVNSQGWLSISIKFHEKKSWRNLLDGEMDLKIEFHIIETFHRK